ncbi:MAG: heavy metal-binding domain-containing protein, partial [Thermoplasmatales archaeon]
LIGTIMGVTVRSRGIGGNLVAGLRSIAGGEIKEYVKMLTDARNEAMERLKQAALAVGANAVIDLRFDSSELGQTMSEIVAYGTAVFVEDANENIQRVSLS